jgi:dTDP-4-dehydrorhamnose reductase
MAEHDRVMVLGASGMLGHVVLRILADDPEREVVGTIRSSSALQLLPERLRDRIIAGVDVTNIDALTAVFARVRPTAVVNCVGLVKQLDDADDPLVALPINAELPHRLNRLCAIAGARLIHVSTDCVFSGDKGNYGESDASDAVDLYGKSKYIGEVGGPGAVTLRTSIIGHELATRHGLIEWFLAQRAEVRGYRRAIFSGLPTVELARVIRDLVIPNRELTGLYHVSATAINKHELLSLVAMQYGSAVKIIPDDRVQIDRSLNSDRFRQATGYEPAAWPELIRRMHDYH